jgi:hypothetical protein
MVNSWSLLYDELKMSENFESTYESSIPKSKDYTVLGGSNSSDTISLISAIMFSPDFNTTNLIDILLHILLRL